MFVQGGGGGSKVFKGVGGMTSSLSRKGLIAYLYRNLYTCYFSVGGPESWPLSSSGSEHELNQMPQLDVTQQLSCWCLQKMAIQIDAFLKSLSLKWRLLIEKDTSFPGVMIQFDA